MSLTNWICRKIFTYFSSPYIFYKFLQGVTRKFKMFVCPLKTYKPIYVILCTIWYHLYNFKNAKSTHGVVLLLLKLQVSACNFAKSNTLPWVFFMFFKVYKWYQIAQCASHNAMNNPCGMKSNAFGKSVRTAPLVFVLSSDFFSFFYCPC